MFKLDHLKIILNLKDKDDLINDSASNFYKRRITTINNPNDMNSNDKQSPIQPASPSPTQGSISNKLSTMTNLSPRNSTTANAIEPNAVNPTILSLTASQNTDTNRRYSSAPVASKDEQAELIRKQKAKLERHFRRSTTVIITLL